MIMFWTEDDWFHMTNDLIMLCSGRHILLLNLFLMYQQSFSVGLYMFQLSSCRFVEIFVMFLSMKKRYGLSKVKFFF